MPEHGARRPVDLPEFLLVCIAEDEAAARAATPGPWVWEAQPWEWDDSAEKQPPGEWEWGHHGPDLMTSAAGLDRPYVLTSFGYDTDNVTVKQADAAHIARHDPAHVLAWCAAVRAVVDQYQASVTLLDDPNPDTVLAMRFARAALEVTLRHLAVIWADHPDFNPAWRT